jgi:hypothetical protein
MDTPLSYFSQHTQFICNLPFHELRWLNRNSDWLRVGLMRGRSGRVKNVHFSISSRTAMEFTQPPIQWVAGTVSPGVKWQQREADH